MRARRLGGVRSLLFLFCGLTGSCALAGDGSSELPVLRILNWSDYIEIDEEADASLPIVARSPILREFAARHGCEIDYHEFEDSTEVRALLAAAPHYFDLICVSHGDAQEYGGLGLLEAIDRERIQMIDVGGIQASFPTLPSEYVYGVPYLLGTTGIVYRRDQTPPPTWAAFFDDEGPAIGILSDAELIFAFLLKACGFDPGTTDPAAFGAAAAKLHHLVEKGRIGLVSSDPDEVAAALASGSIAWAIHYSGDVLSMIEENPDLGYYTPADGGEVYTDLWCLPVGSKQRDLAYAFVQFISEAEISAANSAYLGYASPILGAQEILLRDKPEHMKNPAIYLQPEAAQRLFPVYGVPELAGMFWRRVFP